MNPQLVVHNPPPTGTSTKRRDSTGTRSRRAGSGQGEAALLLALLEGTCLALGQSSRGGSQTPTLGAHASHRGGPGPHMWTEEKPGLGGAGQRPESDPALPQPLGAPRFPAWGAPGLERGPPGRWGSACSRGVTAHPLGSSGSGPEWT